MRLVLVSDTHNLHGQLQLPAGDVLVHCGDFTELGTKEEVRDFAAWLREQPFAHKVLIAGNHDATFAPHRSVSANLHRLGESDDFADYRVVFHSLFNGVCTYLEDAFCDVAGLRFYGSPHCHSKYNNMAFTTKQEQGACSGGLRRLHEALAEGRQPDALLVHGPPAGVLDKSIRGVRGGCRHLRTLLDSGGLRPKLVASGHIHEGYGHLALRLPPPPPEVPEGYDADADALALAVNASSVPVTVWGPLNEPVVVEWGAGGPAVVSGGGDATRGRGPLPVASLPLLSEPSELDPAFDFQEA
eukprot:tig00000658_g2920.t1